MERVVSGDRRRCDVMRRGGGDRWVVVMLELSHNQEERQAIEVGKDRLITAQTLWIKQCTRALVSEMTTAERKAIMADCRVYSELAPSVRGAWLIRWHDRQQYIHQKPGRRA